MRIALVLTIMMLVSGCASPSDKADEPLTSTTSLETGNETVSPVLNETIATFSLSLSLPNGTDDVPAGESIQMVIGSDLPADAAANATWQVMVLDEAGNETTQMQGTGLPANVTFELEAGNYTAAVAALAEGYAQANATIALPLVIDLVLDPAMASVMIVDETFTGTLPDTSPFTGSHDFDVPAGGVYLRFTYTSDYIGMFAAVATLTDANGKEVFYSLDDCDFPFLTQPTGPETCVMEGAYDMPAGTWNAKVNYQAGQAIERYEMTVEAWAF